MKDSEKSGKYVDLAWVQKKKLWDMKVTMMQIVICVILDEPRSSEIQHY